MEEEKELVIKKELKLKLNSVDNKWHVENAKGFYPQTETWSKEELREFTNNNPDVKLNLIY